MRQQKFCRHGEDHDRFILLALLKEGPLSSDELTEKVNSIVQQVTLFGMNLAHSLVRSLGFNPDRERNERLDSPLHEKKREHRQDFEIAAEVEKPLTRGLVVVTETGKLALTEAGEEEAKRCVAHIEQMAQKLDANLLSSSAAARNTVVADFFLALMKLIAGFLSGSVGLIADGADAAIDTASAAVVWLGIKFRKELVGTFVIIVMMFVTSGSIGFESLTKVLAAVTTSIPPLSMPYLVILVESLALIAAVLLGLYQRFVGKRTGSLALISQSVDSKNHIYVAAAVIIGAVFSIFGIHYVDALIGAYIAVRILKDGAVLTGEAVSSLKGETPDLARYPAPLEQHWEQSKLESFRGWILYAVAEHHLRTKDELIETLNRVFKPGYLPLLHELSFDLARGIDFDREFDMLIKPLLTKKLLRQDGDAFLLTREGKQNVRRIVEHMRYHQND
ncbi:MAG: cation transporter [Methanomicrobia archaeon]|nr:cation transporter [Methanomicrobia archaeon]